MGTVYRCDDPMLNRRVAVKILHLGVLEPNQLRELGERFSREAQSAARLNHPNIATIYEFGSEPSGLLYIAMEHVDGPALATVLGEGQKMELVRCLRIAHQLASALAHAHEHGVVHRDVKPGNILLARGDTVKLVDFGIARLGSSNLTQRGLVLGSPGYLSPEAASGSEVDYRADQFSLGTVLFEMVTGTKLFKTHDVMQSLAQVIWTPTPPLASFGIKNKRLQAFLSRVHQKDRAARYADESELLHDLSNLLEDAR